MPQTSSIPSLLAIADEVRFAAQFFLDLTADGNVSPTQAQKDRLKKLLDDCVADLTQAANKAKLVVGIETGAGQVPLVQDDPPPPAA